MLRHGRNVNPVLEPCTSTMHVAFEEVFLACCKCFYMQCTMALLCRDWGKMQGPSFLMDFEHMYPVEPTDYGRAHFVREENDVARIHSSSRA